MSPRNAVCYTRTGHFTFIALFCSSPSELCRWLNRTNDNGGSNQIAPVKVAKRVGSDQVSDCWMFVGADQTATSR